MQDKKGEYLLLLGGALLLIGNFVAFLTIDGGDSFTTKDLDEASSYYISGALAIIVALVRMFSAGGAGRVMTIIGLIGIAFFGVFASLRDYTSIDDLSGEGFDASAGIGAYMLVGGSIIALIGCLLALKSPSAPSASPPA